MSGNKKRLSAFALVTVVSVVGSLASIGCGAAAKKAGGASGTGSLAGTGGGAGLGATGAGTTGTNTAGAAGTVSGAGTGAGTSGSFIDGGNIAPTPTGDAGVGNALDTFKTQFPGVTDWKGLELVYPTSYSGFDGVHTFKLPIRARCTPLPVSAWHAIPAEAVTFDADPDNANGVMITIVQPTAEIMIAAVSDTKGGTAPLHVTIGTPDQWSLGDTRYHTGSDWTLNLLAPMAPPPDTKCTVCHGSNSSSTFNVQHTPTQCARISDDGLTQIMTTGTKPADVPFRVLPDTITFGTTMYTNAQLYMMFHLWKATPDQLKGMILYLRSLTPTGQGCVTNPTTGVCTNVMGNPNAECMTADGGVPDSGTGG